MLYIYLSKHLVDVAPVDVEEWEHDSGSVLKQREVTYISLSTSALKRNGCSGSAADRNQINVLEKLYDSSLPAVLPP